LKRKFEMYQYRQVLVRMRQGDSDRDIDRSKIMGRKKLAAVREIAIERGWLYPGSALPDDPQLAIVFSRKEFLPGSCISSAEPWREQIAQWHDAGVPGTTIHSALVRNHGYAGSYSSVYRLLQQLKADVTPEVPMRLEFKPAEAAQVDFGAGPTITDAHTGEIHKTWFFVMTLCWSRHQYVEFVRDQSVDTGCCVIVMPSSGSTAWLDASLSTTPSVPSSGPVSTNPKFSAPTAAIMSEFADNDEAVQTRLQ
jgi:hypothetical protein